MSLGDVVDQLHDHDGLADTRSAEEADLSALHERRDQVDDLDAGLEDFGLRLEIREERRGPVNRPALDAIRNWRTVVDRISQHVEDSSERSLTDRDGDR